MLAAGGAKPGGNDDDDRDEPGKNSGGSRREKITHLHAETVAAFKSVSTFSAEWLRFNLNKTGGASVLASRILVETFLFFRLARTLAPPNQSVTGGILYLRLKISPLRPA
jgi:hypothetical protein